MAAMTEVRHGALYVMATVGDKDWIQRRLRQLDPRLFVERQVDLDNEAVWCVVEEPPEGIEVPPVTVYEHRDQQGRPIPYLTEGIVDEMLRRAQQGRRSMEELAKEAHRNNETRRQKAREKYRQDIEDQIRETQKTLRSKHSIPGIRGPVLRSTRAKMRERGIKC